MIVGTDINLVLSGRHILKDVCISLIAGEVLAVCGPNGAGKSTLLSSLAGEHRQCAASITYFGTPLSDLSPLDMSLSRVVLEQSPSLSAEFTLAELVDLGAPMALSPAQVSRLRDAVLTEFGLQDMDRRFVSTLSGGQRHRAHLARVLLQLRGNQLLGQTGFLFLDEPTASLDIAYQISVLNLTRALASQGVGVLIVLHDLNLAAAFADRVILMRDGQILLADTPDEAMTDQKLSDLYKTPIFVERASTGQIVIQPALRS